MNKPLLAVACLLGAVAGAWGQHTIRVAPGGQGTGADWDDPADLREALDRAAAGDQLWLRAGTYLTTAGDDRSATFRVPSGVRVLGGFAGKERSAAARDARRHVTELSGAIGGEGRGDDAYTVVHLADASSGTVLDGLTVRAGYANGAGPTADAKRAAGAVLISLSQPGTSARPAFAGVTFAGNYARDGGAVYVDARGGRVEASFVDCVFADNEADLDGGALYVDARQRGEAQVSLQGCRFEGNVANYGGAVFSQGSEGRVAVRAAGTRFAGNRAYVRGPTLYELDRRGASDVQLHDCEIAESGAAKDGDQATQARAQR